MSGFTSRRIVIAGLLAFTFVWCPTVFLRSAVASPGRQSQKASESSEWLSAENRWQLTAVDISSQSDTATPELRAKRNAYLEPHLKVAREWREPTDLPLGVFSM